MNIIKFKVHPLEFAVLTCFASVSIISLCAVKQVDNEHATPLDSMCDKIEISPNNKIFPVLEYSVSQ